MTITYDPNFLQHTNSQLTKFKPTAWLFSHTMHHLDRTIYKMSNDRSTAASMLTGLPIIILTTTGAKSGKARTTPLIVTPHGDDLILIASYYGNKRHPGWYHNLKAHPACGVEWNGRSRTYIAREASREEKATCWQLATQIFPTYDIYKTRTGGREIPLMILTPKERTQMNANDSSHN